MKQESLLASLLHVGMGSGDHLQDNGLLWLHETFSVQNKRDLEQEEKKKHKRKPQNSQISLEKGQS